MEEEVKEKKKRISAITIFLLFLILLLISALAIVGTLFLKQQRLIDYSNVISQGTIDNIDHVTPGSVLKIDENKDLVYDAKYTYDVSETSYIMPYSEDGSGRYSINDIVVPFINIRSVDANLANKEIEALYQSLVNEYKHYLLHDKISFVNSSYVSYTNGNVLSILITINRGGTDVGSTQYYTHNFDISTLTVLSYVDIYTNCGFNGNDITSNVESKITSYLYNGSWFKFSTKEEGSSYVESSIKNYTDSVIDNSIKYFIDNENNLNIIVNITVPVGDGEFNRIITVK